MSWSAALSRSGCRLKPAFQAASAVDLDQDNDESELAETRVRELRFPVRSTGRLPDGAPTQAI